MKTSFFLPAVAALMIVTFASCKKSNPGRHGEAIGTTNISLNAIVQAGDTYRLNLSQYGNGNASIIKQASAYTVSQISMDAGGNKVYQYAPSLLPKNGINTDAVVLKVGSTGRHSGGCRNDDDDDDDDNAESSEKIINIKFTIN